MLMRPYHNLVRFKPPPATRHAESYRRRIDLVQGRDRDPAFRPQPGAVGGGRAEWQEQSAALGRGTGDEAFGRMLQLRTPDGLAVRLLEPERDLIG